MKSFDNTRGGETSLKDNFDNDNDAEVDDWGLQTNKKPQHHDPSIPRWSRREQRALGGFSTPVARLAAPGISRILMMVLEVVVVMIAKKRMTLMSTMLILMTLLVM